MYPRDKYKHLYNSAHQKMDELNQAEAESEFKEKYLLSKYLAKYSAENKPRRIFPITEGIPSPYTQKAYLRSLKRFLDFVKIYDLQVLLDFSPKVIKEMIVDYILFLRDEKPGKKLGRSSIKTHISAILHFFVINKDDFNLTMKNFRIHLPPKRARLSICEQR